MTSPGLRLASLSVGYGTQPIVTSVDLAVARGEFVGVVGPNGAGKSTLVRAISGGSDVLGGTLEVVGKSYDQLDSAARARIVAVVPQSPPTLFSFTAREFVEMGRHSHLGRLAATDSHDAAVIERAMRRTDTWRLADEPVDTLSGGDVQRLTLAQALAQEPEVLLLDEPTSHLDLNHRLQVLDLVRELVDDDGVAVLGVFHDLDLAARYSDRLAVVVNGTVPTIGRPEEVLTSQLVRDVFAVRAVVGTDVVTGTVSVTPVVREQATDDVCRGTVLLVCGAGSGAALMRKLTLGGYRVIPAALNVGDVDFGVAETLDLPLLALAPFGQMTSGDTDEVCERARAADVCVVCDVAFGRANVGNLEAVASVETPTVLMGVMDETRDFASGEAGELWDAMIARGARQVRSSDEAVDAVGEIVATLGT